MQVKKGLGWSHEKSNLSRSVEQNTNINAHQLSGVINSDQQYTVTPVSFERLQCSHKVRQHYCMPVHTPQGGTRSVQLCVPTLKLDIVNQIQLKAVHIRGIHNVLAVTENKSDRVVFEQCIGVENIQTLVWQNMFVYAYPSLKLIPSVLTHVKLNAMILVAPQWPRQHCMFLESVDIKSI